MTTQSCNRDDLMQLAPFFSQPNQFSCCHRWLYRTDSLVKRLRRKQSTEEQSLVSREKPAVQWANGGRDGPRSQARLPAAIPCNCNCAHAH